MGINKRINELEKQLNELKASLKEEAKDNRPITERVKTFKDACRALGDNHQLVSEWSVVSELTNISPDLRAFFKLRIITAALNEEWEKNLSIQRAMLIDKACAWLNAHNETSPTGGDGVDIESFRKDMENKYFKIK